MPTHVALLRGVNVGGRNRVAMADLREVVSSLGHSDVATYLQSGNVVFTSAAAAGLAIALEQAIADRADVRPQVVVLSRAELAEVVATNPYGHEADPKRVHAVFRVVEPGPDERTAVALAVRDSRQRGARDDASVVGRTLFLHTPDGFGRSDLAARLARRPGSGTARNWATVTALLRLLEA